MIFYTIGKEIARHIPENRAYIRSGSIITGQYTHHLERLSGSPEILFIMVVFKPGSLYRVIGIPQYELVNRDIDLEAVFPEKVSLVNRQLKDCSNYTYIIKIIENFLISLTSSLKFPEPRSDKIFDSMLWNNANFSVDHLAGQACLSSRQFERRSYLYSGVCPKVYVRLARFNRSYQLRLQNPQLDWLSIALMCGYYDYQHMAKDYLEFANKKPNVLFDEENRSLERLLGLNKLNVKMSDLYH